MTRASPTKSLPLRLKPEDKPQHLVTPPQPPLPALPPRPESPTSSLPSSDSSTTSTSSTMDNGRQQTPRQPDMDRIENGMKIIAEEIGNIVNIPAIQDSRRITEAIHGINTRLDGMNDQLNSLRQQLDASNHNQSARIFNNRLRDGCQQLTPFRDPRTNGVIVDFPVTGDALKELSISQLDSIIAALGMQPVLGLQDDKVVALKMHIGAIFP